MALGKFTCKDIIKGASSLLDFSRLSSAFVALSVEHFNTFSFCLHKSIICIADNYEHGGVVLAEVRFRTEKYCSFSLCSSCYNIPEYFVPLL